MMPDTMPDTTTPPAPAWLSMWLPLDSAAKQVGMKDAKALAAWARRQNRRGVQIRRMRGRINADDLQAAMEAEANRHAVVCAARAESLRKHPNLR